MIPDFGCITHYRVREAGVETICCNMRQWGGGDDEHKELGGSWLHLGVQAGLYDTEESVT